MPTITDREAFNGARERIERLGLQPLWDELESILTGYDLRIEERRDANGAAMVRAMIDERFEAAGGWSHRKTGGVDWTKCLHVNGTRVCLGVEVQVSGRGDLLLVAVADLRDALTAGAIDVGVIVTPADALASSRRVLLSPCFSAATRAVHQLRADDLPLIVLGLAGGGEGLQRAATAAALSLEETRQALAALDADRVNSDRF